MLTKSVLEYVAAAYGILVGTFLPLIYLHGRVYFRKNKFGFRVLLAYLARLAIIITFYGVLVGAFLLGAARYVSEDGFMESSPWYLVGFFIGLLGSITFCVVGLRQARRQHKTDKTKVV